MKKFPIIITVLLTLLWFYICWYWHTCQIKGFCYVEKLDGEIALEIPNETTDTQEEITPPPLEEIQTTESEETMTQTGTLQENQETLPSNEEVSLQKQECEDIITQAISLGGNNSEEQVLNLETFLSTKEGEALDVDGRYSQDDFDAVKRFQLKYRADILDPSGIANPTGYVYNNTIKKINELNCQ